MIDGEFCKLFFKQHLKIFEKVVKTQYKEIYDYVMYHTQFLDNTYSFSDRKYCILNDITELPKCIVCGKPARLRKKCCCNECVKIYNKSPECISKKISKSKALHGDDCFTHKKTKLEYLSKSNPQLFDKLMSIKWLSMDASYAERMYCCKHEIKQQPVCVECGKPVHFISSHGYPQTCCEKCRNEYVSKKLSSKTSEEWKQICEKRKRSLTDEVKQNAAVKRKQTCNEKYGGNAPSCSDNVKQKMKQTCLLNYGVDNIFKNKEYIKQKTTEKYGVDNIFKNKEYIKQKQIEKFGSVTSQRHLPKETIEILNSEQMFKDFMKNNSIKSVVDLCKQLSISEFCALKYIHEYNQIQLLNRNVSHYEDELTEWLHNHNIQTINNKRLLNGKEIDIYLPDFRIGIEFNGNYWHSDIFKSKLYHQQKSLHAKQHDIFLYHIFEYEWLVNKSKILDHLSNILHIVNQRIYARKCVVKEIDSNTCNIFLDNNHIQGHDSSKIKLGLYFNDTLVMVMTFCKPRFNKNYEWELSRLCTTKSMNVIGGASKLFTYFLNTYTPHNIISYSNFSKNKGNIYSILNFKHLKLSSPNYVWCNGNITLPRYQTQKHKLIAEGYTGTSETEIMVERGFYRIHDCGNDVWIWE